jgi:hypothetical protein
MGSRLILRKTYNWRRVPLNIGLIAIGIPALDCLLIPAELFGPIVPGAKVVGGSAVR